MESEERSTKDAPRWTLNEDQAMPGNPSTLGQIWKAIRQLNPGAAARQSTEPFTLALVATNQADVVSMREFLLGPNPSLEVQANADRVLRTYVPPLIRVVRLDDAGRRDLDAADLVLATEDAVPELEHLMSRLFRFDPQKPELAVRFIVNSRPGSRLRLSLARHLPAFRPEVTRRIVREVSRENAVFVIATALGNVVPNVLQPLLGAAEAAGDMAFLTANQVRMIFLIGAAYGARIGYMAQWPEISSVIGAGFGWRALARNLVSKIPFGGGLVPKGAVAYAGTAVVGEGLTFFYTTGRRMTREEVGQAFKRSYSQALGTARSLVDKLRPGSSGREAPSEPDPGSDESASSGT